VIVEWVLNVFGVLVTGAVGLLGTVTVPDWFSGLGDSVSGLLGDLNGLGAWLPFGAMAVVLAAVIAARLLGVGIKLTRVVLSFFLAGGGSAG
jgi:hypothetical protein